MVVRARFPVYNPRPLFYERLVGDSTAGYWILPDGTMVDRQALRYTQSSASEEDTGYTDLPLFAAPERKDA